VTAIIQPAITEFCLEVIVIRRTKAGPPERPCVLITFEGKCQVN
jgi:hypothetical protein